MGMSAFIEILPISRRYRAIATNYNFPEDGSKIHMIRL